MALSSFLHSFTYHLSVCKLWKNGCFAWIACWCSWPKMNDTSYNAMWLMVSIGAGSPLNTPVSGVRWTKVASGLWSGIKGRGWKRSQRDWIISISRILIKGAFKAPLFLWKILKTDKICLVVSFYKGKGGDWTISSARSVATAAAVQTNKVRSEERESLPS